MNEDDVRRIVREEIVKAFRIFETEAEPTPHSGVGDFERIVRGVLGDVIDETAEEIVAGANGDRPLCMECVERGSHETWCSGYGA